MAKANAKVVGSSPTLSVKNTWYDLELWVSMEGSQQVHGYLLGCSSTRMKRRWFGLRKAKTTRWLEIYLTRDKLTITHSFCLYFTGKHEQLLAEIRKLQRFTALETRN